MFMISFVIPCYKSTKTIEQVVDDIKELMKIRHENYEIILINDGSNDDTYDTIKHICKNNTQVKGIDFSRNFGQHSAVMAGLRLSTGDYVVCLDDDGQTPASEANKLLDALSTYDVVYAKYHNKQHERYRNWGSTVNSKMAELLLGKPKQLYISSYFAAKKYVVDEIKQYVNPYPYIAGLILRTTDNIGNVYVEHRARKNGKSGYTMRKLIGLWINGFTSFSVKPLRLATYLGIFTSFVGVIMSIFIIINKIVNEEVPIGWSSIMVAMLFIGGVLLTTVGLLGEYIGRIYICMNASPQYVIKEKTNF